MTSGGRPRQAPRRALRPAPPRPPRGARSERAEQLALFPEAVDVRPLDPGLVAGKHTRVRGVWLVRHASVSERDPAPHRVFADRHGWYCEEHGPRCRAVAAARAADDATPGGAR